MANPNEEPTAEDIDLLRGALENNSDEELNQEVQVEVEDKVDSTEPEEVEIDPRMERALKAGWLPKDDFLSNPKNEGKEDDWVDFDEFNRRAPLFDAIGKLNKKIKDMEKANANLVQHHNNVKAQAVEEAIKQLREERADAIASGDGQRVNELDDQIDAQKAQQAEVQNQNPIFDAWLENNQWYNEDAELRNYATRIGKGYAIDNPDASPSEVFEYAEAETKARYREKFEPPKPRASSVAGAKPSGKPAKATKKAGDTITLNDVPEEDRDSVRQIMFQFERNGIMTREQYLQEYAKSNGIIK